MSKNIKPLAFYLPQFHPTAENDSWWGKGFTEWTNVGKAKPLFNGHQQPICPGELGYYDLRLSEVREQQAQMAKEYGVYGFIYYHYWFGDGKMVLERIAEEVLHSKKPDFPFCFCWANETWSGIWHGLTNKILAEQTYPGEADIKKHFAYLLPFFKDDRYIKVDGKPLLMIYESEKFPNSSEYLEIYRGLAKENGFKDLYIIASNKGADNVDYNTLGYDAKVSNSYNKSFDESKDTWNKSQVGQRLKRKLYSYLGKECSIKGPVRIDGQEVFDKVIYERLNVDTYPMVLPNWDNTPRSGERGVVLENTNAVMFEKEVCKAMRFIKEQSNTEQFLIIKSWNEWAEGNVLEPDYKNGFSFLNVIKKLIKDA